MRTRLGCSFAFVFTLGCGGTVAVPPGRGVIPPPDPGMMGSGEEDAGVETVPLDSGPASTPLPDLTDAAAPSDARVAPLPLDGGSARDAGPCRFKMCEGFETVAEGQAPDKAVWKTAITGKGKLKVDSVRAAHGHMALHITTPLTASETYIRQKIPFASPTNTWFGRLYFWIDALRKPTATTVVHWDFVEGRGADNKTRVRFGGIGNLPIAREYFLFDLDSNGNGEAGRDDTYTKNDPQVVPGTWTCVEWMFKGNTNETQFWWNGVERPRLHVVTTTLSPKAFTMPTFTDLYFGWAIRQTIDAPYDVWIDDIAVNDQRIGCDL